MWDPGSHRSISNGERLSCRCEVDFGDNCTTLGSPLLPPRFTVSCLPYFSRQRAWDGWMKFWKGVCLALLLSGGTKERRTYPGTRKKSVKRKVCSSSSRLDSLGLSFFNGLLFQEIECWWEPMFVVNYSIRTVYELWPIWKEDIGSRGEGIL